MTLDRPAYIKMLRDLALLLEANPELPLPYQGDRLSWFVRDSIKAAANLRLELDNPKLCYDSRDTHFPVRVQGMLFGREACIYVDSKIALIEQPATTPKIDRRLGELA